MIRLEEVSVAYGSKSAICGITLEIRRGDSVAILGPNGSGKSTLLKLLNGIVLPDSGRYHFDGIDVTKEHLKDQSLAKRFHQRIGFLFQNPDTQLFCASVREEVEFGPRQMGLEENEVEARASDCMELLGVESLALRAPWHLSEGEKRKVALASILAMNPEVLTLDEPMNGIDPKTRRFLWELFNSLLASGKTILCATHDLQSMAGVFRTAIVLSEDHHLVRVGPYQELVCDRSFMQAVNLF